MKVIVVTDLFRIIRSNDAHVSLSMRCTFDVMEN